MSLKHVSRYSTHNKRNANKDNDKYHLLPIRLTKSKRFISQYYHGCEKTGMLLVGV